MSRASSYINIITLGFDSDITHFDADGSELSTEIVLQSEMPSALYSMHKTSPIVHAYYNGKMLPFKNEIKDARRAITVLITNDELILKNKSKLRCIADVSPRVQIDSSK